MNGKKKLQIPRLDWKLAGWERVGAFAKEAVAKAQQTYGVKYPSDYLYTKQGQLKVADWVLSFKAPGVASIGWMHVDFVIPVSRSDKAAFDNDYPFQAVQANPSTSCRPPFKLDPAFCNAFKRALKEFGVEELKWCRPPPKSLLDLITKNMAT